MITRAMSVASVKLNCLREDDRRHNVRSQQPLRFARSLSEHHCAITPLPWLAYPIFFCYFATPQRGSIG